MNEWLNEWVSELELKGQGREQVSFPVSLWTPQHVIPCFNGEETHGAASSDTGYSPGLDIAVDQSTNSELKDKSKN